MKTIYYVTEGVTDQIVLDGLIANWLEHDYVPRNIQPPSSAYADEITDNLSQGWKGVRDWCAGVRSSGPLSRDEVLQEADCLVVHIDADVARDPDFKSPPMTGPCQPREESDWVGGHLADLFGGDLPENVVLCTPAQDLEAWVLCALHPTEADRHAPIECRANPGTLLIGKPPRLIQRKSTRIRKVVQGYRDNLERIVEGWRNCTAGNAPRCPEAVRFEREARRVLTR